LAAGSIRPLTLSGPPTLSESILTGEVHDKVVIDAAVAAPRGAEATYFQIELEKVRLTSHSFSGDDGSVPTESFSLNFEEIKWTYTDPNDRDALIDRDSAAGRVEESLLFIEAAHACESRLAALPSDGPVQIEAPAS